MGFTVASVVFDAVAWIARYDSYFRKASLTAISLLFTSVLSAAVASLIIGNYFMAPSALVSWAGILGWAVLHAIGCIIDGFIGAMMVTGLVARGFRTMGARK